MKPVKAKKPVLYLIFFILILLISEYAFSSEKFRGSKPKAQYFTLNFKDTEISEFLNVMSGYLGKTIVFDPAIKGRITIVSARRIPLKNALSVLRTILESNGLAVIELKDLLKVIPLKEAAKKNREIIIDMDR